MRWRGRIFLVAVVLLLGILAAGCGKGGASRRGIAPAGDKGQGQAGFQEYPIGDEQRLEGLNIAAVYFQPVPMEPSSKAGLAPSQSDLHLEADIKATEENKTGFGIGEWVPFLGVKYRLKNLESGQEVKGSLMPMNASDGPHYGANVKLPGGAGKYRLTFTMESPEKQDFLLHVDKETGVEGRFWTAPLEVSWEFPWLPRKW